MCAASPSFCALDFSFVLVCTTRNLNVGSLENFSCSSYSFLKPHGGVREFRNTCGPYLCVSTVRGVRVSRRRRRGTKDTPCSIGVLRVPQPSTVMVAHKVSTTKRNGRVQDYLDTDGP
jgi:hypothetical protein